MTQRSGHTAGLAARFHAEALEGRTLFALPSGFAASEWGEGLTRPVSMDLAPDGRAFVTEQDGKLRVVAADGRLKSTPFATLSVRADGERGLLGVVLDPNFATNRFLYVYWTSTEGGQHQVISRFTADAANPDVAAPGSRVDLLHLPELAAGNHLGGAMHFGADGKLYVVVGEHGTPSHAQTLANPYGKVLRINAADGSFPSDNPFFDTPGAYKGIYALGLRNPFTFAVDPGHAGRAFVNDVGQGGFEEVNPLAAGANYGWPQTEGAFDPDDHPEFTNPIHATEHGSIAGGAFYRPAAGAARAWPASYQGDYLFTDYRRTDVRVLDASDGFASDATFATSLVDEPVDVDVDEATGDVLILTRDGARTGTGVVVRVAYTASDAPAVGAQPQDRTVAVGQPATFSVRASGAAPLSYQWQRDGQDIPGATSDTYTFPSAQPADDGAEFRAVVTNARGSATSDAATLTVTANQPPTATIAAPAGGATFRAGETIEFSGTATDGEDGTLPASAFTWRVDLHHDDHTHPALPPTSGITAGSYATPTVGETSANIWYRVHLTVTDGGGQTHGTFVDVTPVTSNVTLATNVAGLSLSLDGTPAATPTTFTGVAGTIRTVGAPASQTLDGVTYDFASWSDGGAATHDIATPDANATLTAVYQARTGTGPGPNPPVDPGTGTGGDLTAVLGGRLPARAMNGSTGRVTVRVNNTGDAPVADLVTVSLFLSTDASLDSADAAAGSASKRLKLTPGKGRAVPMTFTYPSVADGSYFLLAQVDPADAIGEARELNNVAASAAPVPVEAPVVNLSGTVTGPTPAAVTRGGRASAVLNLTNSGNVTAKGSLTVSVYAASDGAGSDNAATVLTLTKALKLKPGSSRALRLNLAFPADLPAGAYFLAASVDAENRIAESNETDNLLVSGAAFQVA